MRDNAAGGFRGRLNRRSIRLKGYDYSQPGAYFITIVTQDRECLLGQVVDGEMRLNDAGRMICEAWNALPNRFRNVDLAAFIVMPNRSHRILILTDTEPNPAGAALVPAPNATTSTGAIPNRATTTVAPPLGDMVGVLRSVTTIRCIQGIKRSGWPPFRGRLWQRNYYEHIIRDEQSLHRIREYIANNPLQWASDRENPDMMRGVRETSLPKDEPWRV